MSKVGKATQAKNLLLILVSDNFFSIIITYEFKIMIRFTFSGTMYKLQVKFLLGPLSGKSDFESNF